MAKPKGARANKPNDSFGTVNDNSLYRGKYKDDVYKDDEEENTTDEQKAEEKPSDPSEKSSEATQENTSTESFAQKKESKEVDYKKRYDDLKSHYDKKLEEWKVQSKSPQPVPEDQANKNLDDFRNRYPEVHDAVSELAANKAESQLAALKQEVDSLKEKEVELYKQKAYEELLRMQPNFTKLKKDSQFLEWLEVQPTSISNAIYNNSTDAVWASRVVDLYYSDVGEKKSSTPKVTKDAAVSVLSTTTRDVATNKGQERVWKASEIQKLKPWDYEKLEKDIDKARAEGRIDFSS